MQFAKTDWKQATQNYSPAHAHRPLMRAGFELHGGVRVIVNDRITLKHDAFATDHGAVDEQAAAVEEAGSVGEVLLQAVHEFAELLVEVQMGRLALAAGVKAQAEVLGEFVSIRTHGEQVARRFHRGKANA